MLKKFRQAIIVRQKFYENKQQRVNRGKLALKCFDYFTSGTFVFSDEITGHSMQLIFALAFLAIHDKARCKTMFVETLAYSEEALDYFIDGFYEIENGVLVGEESTDDTRQQPGVNKRKCTRGVYHKLLEKLAGIHSGAEMEVLTPQTATWRLQSLVKHQVKHYLATLDEVSYERWSTQLREEAGIPAELWGQLSEIIARTLYDEYQGLYDGPQSTDFLLMLDSGQYVDCRQLDLSRTPYDQSQSSPAHEHGQFFATQVGGVTGEEGCLKKCSSPKT